jgi:hypothetical protein
MRRRSRRAVWLALLLAFPALALAQAEKPVVGRLVGENLVVLGPAGETFIGEGDSKRVTSGSEVRVQSGEARLELVRGGLIRICSPAHFTVLGSGGQFTLALDSGRVEAVPSGTTRLAIYTAQIVARPVKIADEPEEFAVGVEAGGAMCVRAAGGAVELEEQLSGKKLVVPQGGEILLPNGRLAGIREARGACRCQLEMAELPSLPPASTAEASSGRAAPMERGQFFPPVAPSRRSMAPAPPEIAPSAGAPAAQPLEAESAGQPAAPMERAQLQRPTAAPERGVAPAPPEIAPSAGAPAAQPLENEGASQPAAPTERTQLPPPTAAPERGVAPAPPEIAPSAGAPAAQPLENEGASQPAAPMERGQFFPPVAPSRRSMAPAPPEIAPSAGAPAAQPLENEGASQPAAPMERTQLPPPAAAPERGVASAPPEIARSAGAPAAQPLENESAGQPAAPMERAQLPPPAVAPGRGTAPAPPEASSPVWKVNMPPLVFNAGAPSPPPQPGPNPEVLRLVSEARVQPAVVIRGEVAQEAPPRKRGFWSKIGGFFGHLFGHRSRPRG